jgi:hypothetical protein
VKNEGFCRGVGADEGFPGCGTQELAPQGGRELMYRRRSQGLYSAVSPLGLGASENRLEGQSNLVTNTSDGLTGAMARG